MRTYTQLSRSVCVQIATIKYRLLLPTYYLKIPCGILLCVFVWIVDEETYTTGKECVCVVWVLLMRAHTGQ